MAADRSTASSSRGARGRATTTTSRRRLNMNEQGGGGPRKSPGAQESERKRQVAETQARRSARGATASVGTETPTTPTPTPASKRHDHDRPGVATNASTMLRFFAFDGLSLLLSLLVLRVVFQTHLFLTFLALGAAVIFVPLSLWCLQSARVRTFQPTANPEGTVTASSAASNPEVRPSLAVVEEE